MLLFLDVDEDIALARRLSRDVSERGRDVDEVIDRYLRHVSDANKLIMNVKKSSDFILPVNNTGVDRSSIIGAYVNSLLSDTNIK